MTSPLTPSEMRAIEAQYQTIPPAMAGKALQARPEWEKIIPDIAYMSEAAWVAAWQELGVAEAVADQVASFVRIFLGTVLFFVIVSGGSLGIYQPVVGCIGGALFGLTWVVRTKVSRAYDKEFVGKIHDLAERWAAPVAKDRPKATINAETTIQSEGPFAPVDHSNMFDVPPQASAGGQSS